MFSEKQAVPVQASGRILRWVLTLATYEYKISFRPTHKHGNADALSRLPSPTTTAVEDEVPAELVLLLEAIKDLPLTGKGIQDWIRKNPTLSRVYKYIQHGWPQNCSEEFKALNSHKLST